jgi:hypothetical protein
LLQDGVDTESPEKLILGEVFIGGINSNLACYTRSVFPVLLDIVFTRGGKEKK